MLCLILDTSAQTICAQTEVCFTSSSFILGGNYEEMFIWMDLPWGQLLLPGSESQGHLEHCCSGLQRTVRDHHPFAV